MTDERKKARELEKKSFPLGQSTKDPKEVQKIESEKHEGGRKKEDSSTKEE